MAWLLEQACTAAGIQPLLETPNGVEAVWRGDSDTGYLFLLNHNPTEVEIALNRTMNDLLTGREHTDTLQLAPYGVALLGGGAS